MRSTSPTETLAAVPAVGSIPPQTPVITALTFLLAKTDLYVSIAPHKINLTTPISNIKKNSLSRISLGLGGDESVEFVPPIQYRFADLYAPQPALPSVSSQCRRWILDLDRIQPKISSGLIDRQEVRRRLAPAVTIRHPAKRDRQFF